MSANKSAKSTNWPVQYFITNGIGEYPEPTTNGLFSDSAPQIVAGTEDPKSGKDEPCLLGIAGGPLVAPPAAHEDGAVLKDVDNGVTFPANEDVAEANAIVVEWFCIANRILPRPTLEKKQWPDPAGRG